METRQVREGRGRLKKLWGGRVGECQEERCSGLEGEAELASGIRGEPVEKVGGGRDDERVGWGGGIISKLLGAL